jgi:hypothetical protein
LAEGRTLFMAENLLQPGFYSMTTPDQPEGKPALAMNVPREESDLTPLPAGDVPKMLGIERTNVAADLVTLRKQIDEHRVAKTFGEQLLWAAFALIALEFALANSLMRAGKGARASTLTASDKLGKESGTGTGADTGNGAGAKA